MSDGVPRGAQKWALPVFLLVVLALSAAFSAHHLDIGFLAIHHMDEYAYHGSLLGMYDGVRALDLKQFFAFKFYNYGLGFFVLNLVPTMPFLGSNDPRAAIFIPRLITSLFAILGLWFIARTARREVDLGTTLLLLVLALSLPAYWVFATMFHPDWLMTACLLGACFHFARNDSNPGRDYWYGTIWFALAVGLGKFQALTFLPFGMVYVFGRELTRLDFSDFAANLKRALLSLAIVLGLFVTLNPYILHPSGFSAFWRMLVSNMESNTDNMGMTSQIGIADKLNDVAFAYYFNPLLLAAFAGLTFYWCVDLFRKGEARAIHGLAYYVLFLALYLLVAVNKAWPAYYLPLFVPALLLAVPVLRGWTARTRAAVLAVALVSQIGWYQGAYAQLTTLSYQPALVSAEARPEIGVTVTELHSPEYLRHQREVSDFIVAALRGRATPNSVVMMTAYTGFAFDRLGINYRNIVLMPSPLTMAAIDRDALARSSGDVDEATRAFRLAQFRDRDFIILRKGDAHFRPALRERSELRDGYRAGAALIARLDQGELGFARIAENDDVVIYQRRPPGPQESGLADPRQRR